MSKANAITVIFDNGGGITLQIVSPTGFRFEHNYYGHPDQCAHDIREAQAGSDISDWDGNDAEEGWIEPTTDDIRNGGYRVMSVKEVEAVEEAAWRNIEELQESLASK